MRRLVLGLLLTSSFAGCQKADTETLTRIGQKVAGKGRAALGDLRGRVGVDLSWRPPMLEAGLEERIKFRFRFDRDLWDHTLEIKLHGAEVELLGKVRNPVQKRRAVELAETTRGVELVTDHIEIGEPTPPPDPLVEERKGVEPP